MQLKIQATLCLIINVEPITAYSNRVITAYFKRVVTAYCKRVITAYSKRVITAYSKRVITAYSKHAVGSKLLNLAESHKARPLFTSK